MKQASRIASKECEIEDKDDVPYGFGPGEDTSSFYWLPPDLIGLGSFCIFFPFGSFHAHVLGIFIDLKDSTNWPR